MAEQSTTEPEQQAAPAPPKQPAPIDVRSRKPRAHSVPPATRFPAGAVPQQFVTFGDELSAAGAVGSQMMRDALNTLDDAEKVITICADAEDAIIKDENIARHNGAHDGRVAMVDGKVTAIPGQYDQLAKTMGPALDKAITDIDARIHRFNSTMLGLLRQMDDALVCNTTQADKNLMAQVRDHIMGMKKAERGSFALRAAQTGDKVAIHTILTSPAYLLGLETKDVNVVRETARKALAPDQSRAYEIGEKMEKSFALAKKSLADKKARVERYRLEDKRQVSDAMDKLTKLPI